MRRAIMVKGNLRMNLLSAKSTCHSPACAFCLPF
nr:MAG TPA: hypothetical protein [Caudoviricetes sp.]